MTYAPGELILCGYCSRCSGTGCLSCRGSGEVWEVNDLPGDICDEDVAVQIRGDCHRAAFARGRRAYMNGRPRPVAPANCTERTWIGGETLGWNDEAARAETQFLEKAS